MKTKLTISSAASETGPLLRQYLQDRGVYASGGAAEVCYGYYRGGAPSLNKRCVVDKIARMEQMNRAGVQTVPWFRGADLPAGLHFPLLARRSTGHGGTDIVPVFQADEVKWRSRAGWDWFSQYIPIAHEYRVWIFRDQHLDTYEKVMRRPEDYKYIGRNFRNGFEFEKVGEQTGVTCIAKDAVHALELDFGAVDLLQGFDGQLYILEVNTAPGVLRSGAQATLGKLADCIADWVRRQ